MALSLVGDYAGSSSEESEEESEEEQPKPTKPAVSFVFPPSQTERQAVDYVIYSRSAAFSFLSCIPPFPSHPSVGEARFKMS